LTGGGGTTRAEEGKKKKQGNVNRGLVGVSSLKKVPREGPPTYRGGGKEKKTWGKKILKKQQRGGGTHSKKFLSLQVEGGGKGKRVYLEGRGGLKGFITGQPPCFWIANVGVGFVVAHTRELIVSL